jgi:hypothetical protein
LFGSALESVSEQLEELFARDVNGLSHALDCNYDGLVVCFVFEPRHCLLVLGAKPRSDTFFDVLKGFFFVSALRDAPWQGGAFRYNPAIFRMFEGDVKNHTSVSPVQMLPEPAAPHQARVSA